MRERVEASKQNVIDINGSSVWSELLQYEKNANWKLTTSPPMFLLLLLLWILLVQ